MDMRVEVIRLLETYSDRARQIDLLHYEMQHTARISPEEMIDGMSLSHGEGMGGSSRGHISDKTMYIALNYQERMERLNTENMNEISKRLLALEAEQDRIRFYVSRLDRREAEVIQSFYFEGHSWEETAKKVGVALRTVHKIKNCAFNQLAEWYSYMADLR